MIAAERAKCNNVALAFEVTVPPSRSFGSSYESLKQYYGGFFIQRLVVVAALGRLHARGATIGARTVFHTFQCGLPKIEDHVETFLGNADASRVGIIDKDLWFAGVGMEGGGYAANIITVAEGKQGQYTNSGVFTSM
jgi:hypothetical protein